MHRYRFFLTGQFNGGTLPLTRSDVHHVRDVLRLAPGSVVDVVETGGTVLAVRIDGVGVSSVEGTVLESRAHAPRLPLVLCPALSKGRKMDLVVQKATELGVERIVPFASERSVVKLEPAKGVERRERWQRIAEEAAKQCGRGSIPQVDAPLEMEGIASVLRHADRAFVLSEETAPPLRTALAGQAGGSIAMVVGPEGGFTDDEVARLDRLGATPVGLGHLTLRTETAAIVACAIAAYEAGWLGGERA
jgi:16S rRNA (uracil1498-N3)-methyltransferase